MSARETEILAFIEKMAAVPIPPVYSGHFFCRCARFIRVSLTECRAFGYMTPGTVTSIDSPTHVGKNSCFRIQL